MPLMFSSLRFHRKASNENYITAIALDVAVGDADFRTKVLERQGGAADKQIVAQKGIFASTAAMSIFAFRV